MISVVFQYLKHDNDFQEIYHAVASVKKNLKIPHRIQFIGDLPKGMSYPLIPHPRGDVRRTTWYDVCLKMEMIMDCKFISKRFILFNDDHYLLKPITDINTISHFYYLPWPEPSKNYHDIMYRTKEALEANGLNALNCEVHLPHMYNKNKMREIWEIYKPKENALLYSTLYFNHFHKHNKKTRLYKEDRVKAGFYGRDDNTSFDTELPTDSLANLLSNKIFLNHNDKGLSPMLKNVISRNFPYI